jgi:hypothetical protein
MKEALGKLFDQVFNGEPAERWPYGGLNWTITNDSPRAYRRDRTRVHIRTNPNTVRAWALSGLNLSALLRSASAERNLPWRSSDNQLATETTSTRARPTSASTLSGSRSRPRSKLGTRLVEKIGGIALVEKRKPKEIIVHRIRVMSGDGRVDEVAAQTPETRERAILVGARQAAVSDDIRDQNRRELSDLAHPSGTPALRMSSMIRSRRFK